MITVRASQKIFTHAEVVNLTGICVEHLHAFVKRHRLGFIARAAQTAGTPSRTIVVHAVGLGGPGDIVPTLYALIPSPTLSTDPQQM